MVQATTTVPSNANGSATATPTKVERCFYTLWGREKEDQRIWEEVPSEDLVDSIVAGTGRQDWRVLSPFDLLAEIDPATGGVSSRVLYEAETLRIGAEAIVGSQPYFERAGDYDTILFQFAGCAVVETSFGPIEMRPGEALHIPPMVAHRTSGSIACRRMVFLTRDRVEVKLDPAATVTETEFTVLPQGAATDAESLPQPQVPPNGKVRERLSQWDGRPGEAFLFERTYHYMVGKADTGPRPTKVRPFDYFATPPDSPKAAVRTALLWESPTFRQRVYANPGRQPAPHRGYDEDEFWFQFCGTVDQETEHAAYPVECGHTSMAEAGISHTSTSYPGALRLTTYTNKPLRMLVDPGEQRGDTRWQVHTNLVRGWPEA
jgi:hypothetical protein